MIVKYPDDRGRVFESFRYPAGEIQARIPNDQIAAVQAAGTLTIQARIKSSEDLIGLLMLSDALRHVAPYAEQTLHIPYLPYARADRRFTDGDCFGLKVFGELVRGRFGEIITLDVHHKSRAVSAVSRFLRNVSAQPLIARAIADFAPDGDVTLLFPDLGASERYSTVAGSFSGKRAAYATKRRHPSTGALEGFSVPQNLEGKVLVIDDICDGGGTFIGIAREIKAPVTLGLYVTHGIFSKGLAPLWDAGFTDIYTTNSFYEGQSARTRSIAESGITVYDAWEAK